MKLMEIRFLKKGKPVRVLWGFADFLRNLDDGWEPHHWYANWKVLQTQGDMKMYLTLASNSRSGSQSPILVADITVRDNPPNQAGREYDFDKMDGAKEWAMKNVVPKVKELLRKSGIEYETLMEIE